MAITLTEVKNAVLEKEPAMMIKVLDRWQWAETEVGRLNIIRDCQAMAIERLSTEVAESAKREGELNKLVDDLTDKLNAYISAGVVIDA